MIREFEFKGSVEDRLNVPGNGDYLVFEMVVEGTEVRYDLEDLGYWYYLLPERGRYMDTSFHGSLTMTDTRQGITEAVGTVESTHEHLAELDGGLEEYQRFTLYDPDDETPGGRGYVQLHPNRLLPGVEENGDHCYMTVHLEHHLATSEEEAWERVEHFKEIEKEYTTGTRDAGW